MKDTYIEEANTFGTMGGYKPEKVLTRSLIYVEESHILVRGA